MSGQNQQKLSTAEFYKNELEENQRSIDALIALLEHEGEKHPHYNQLNSLKNRNQEIDTQLISLNEIINNLKDKN